MAKVSPMRTGDFDRRGGVAMGIGKELSKANTEAMEKGLLIVPFLR
jgi:hypothetical protein